MRFDVAMKNTIGFGLILTTLLAAGVWMAHARVAEGTHAIRNYLVYIGTYTEPNLKSVGIYVYRFDEATGNLTPMGLAAKSRNPSYLVIHPNHRYLYAVNEINNYEGQPSGGVSAYAIHRKTGMLTLLNEVASRDKGPCHINID